VSGRFGTPASIDPEKVAGLPIAMQREAALMLLDMGLTAAAARRHLGFSAGGFDRLVNMPHAPFRRDGGVNALAEGV
jgi:hypothetical protein